MTTDVTIVGAGPAGLYLAILLRKADPRRAVTVLERNAPDATFGWGVVFSEETLGALREADHPTYLEITDSFARWSTVDIRYRGKVLRCKGHTFSAIARKHLLAILQRRATELGADLRFGVEVDDTVGGGLVIAADGANSGLRRAHADAFRGSVRPLGCKYVWFGTDLVLDAFTFIFRETEHGLFQVHAYPFDEKTSTFIVECPHQTWRRAGLDTMTEQESIAFCENLFAEDLDGHRLMSNKSIWLDFMLVRNANWHAGNLVLLGDSAHTAHFSIGSGTKLAMEDAISLANALVRYPDDVKAALVEYELERQPVVERFQQAAGESAGYFGRVGSYTHLEPIQFAFNLLTRSGRVSHTNLAQRDPDFVRVLDTWVHHASTATGAPELTSFAPAPTFTPMRVGGSTLRNRVVVTGSGDVDGLVAAARTGAGLVLTPPVAVTAEGRRTRQTPVFSAEGWSAVVEKVHAQGALLGLRLSHAGRRAATERPVSASPLPYGPFDPTPTELSEMDAVVTAFSSAARGAGEAGFDAVELDLADGGLLASFLSPLTNKRTDGYGGPLADRLRLPLAVADAVRAAWPRLLIARLTVADWARGGTTVEDGVEVARALAEHGVDLVHVRAGHTVAESKPEYRRGYLTTLSDRVRNQAKVPTLVGGYLTTTDEVNTVVGAGRADLCLLELPASELARTVLV